MLAIEEPELGLQPDILPGLGELIREASKRMQIFHAKHFFDSLKGFCA